MNLEIYYTRLQRLMKTVRASRPGATARMLSYEQKGRWLVQWQIWDGSIRLDEGLHFQSHKAWQSALQRIQR